MHADMYCGAVLEMQIEPVNLSSSRIFLNQISRYSKHENPREFSSRILAHMHTKHFIKFLNIK